MYVKHLTEYGHSVSCSINCNKNLEKKEKSLTAYVSSRRVNTLQKSNLLISMLSFIFFLVPNQLLETKMTTHL